MFTSERSPMTRSRRLPGAGGLVRLRLRRNGSTILHDVDKANGFRGRRRRKAASSSHSPQQPSSSQEGASLLFVTRGTATRPAARPPAASTGTAVSRFGVSTTFTGGMDAAAGREGRSASLAINRRMQESGGFLVVRVLASWGSSWCFSGLTPGDQPVGVITGLGSACRHHLDCQHEAMEDKGLEGKLGVPRVRDYRRRGVAEDFGVAEGGHAVVIINLENM